MMKRLLFLMQMLIAFAAGVSAQETLTVCDGTNTNANLPFAGQYNQGGPQTSQMIYPAADLAVMKDKKITSITFYPTENLGWTSVNTISVAEVEQTAFASKALISTSLTEVAKTKGVQNADKSWTIEFSTPYVYNGGNLLIQGDMPQDYNGNKQFYGVNQSVKTGIISYEDSWLGADKELVGFLPKATFTYEEDSDPDPVDPSVPVVATFDFYNNPWGKSFGNCPDDTFTANDGATTISFIPGGTSTYTIQYKMTDNQLRVYQDDKIVISAPAGKAISKLDFVYSGANDGGLGSSITFDEPAATQTLTLTNNARWTKIEVTLVPGSDDAGGDEGGDAGDDVIPAGYTQLDDFAYSFEDLTSSSYGTVYYNKANAPLGWDYLGSSQSAYSRASSGHTGGYAVSSSSDNSTKAVDQNYYIITPMVKGDVKIWAKASSTYAGYDGIQMVKAYKVTKNEDGSLNYPTDDDLLTSVNLGLNTSYQQITLAEGLEKYTYIAIALSRAYVDDLTATSALMPENPGLEVFAFTSEWTDNNPLYADAEGKATFTAKFKVRNVGNVDLKAGRDNYSVTVVSQSTSSVTIPETIIPISVDLAQGEESQEIELSVECTIANLANGDGRTAIRVTSNLLKHGTTATTSANYQQSSWFTVKNLAPKLIVKEGSNDLTSNALSFGIVSGQGTKTISLKNDGGSTLHITSVTSTIDNGFSFNAPLPFVIEKGETREATITIGGTEGFKSGEVTFTYDGGRTVETKAISATVVNADTYLETFNSGIPASWVNENGSNWSATTQTTNGWVLNSQQSYPEAMLISPKIAFTAGQTLSVAATPRNASASESYDVYLQVYYSADRTNWQKANVLAAANTRKSVEGWDAEQFIPWILQGGGGVNDCKTYVLNGIPAGEWYIGFKSGYALIDHIFGGKLATVENDLYISPLNVVAGKSMVNYPVKATVSYKNMNNVEAAAHTVTLYDGDEVIGTENIASLAATTSNSVDFTFTPHVDGVHNLKAIVAIDGTDYSVETAVEAVNILAEEMPAEAMAGTRTSSTNGYVPFHTYYTYNRSEWIWTADKMPDLKDGDVISNISFPYYNTDKDVNIANVKLYLVNVDDATFATATRTDLTNLEPVFSASNFVLKKEGSSSNKAMMEITLDENFTYTGGNIKAIFIAEELTNKASYSSMNARFEYYSASNAAMYLYNNTESYYLSNNPTRTNYVPVAVLGLVAQAPVLSGTISDAGVAVENATVEAKSGDVVYTATTDADGKYSMEIMQPTLEYVVTVKAYGYDAFVSEVETIAEGNDIALVRHTLTLPETVNTYKYTTLIDTQYDMEIPAGVKAYIAENVEGDEISYTEITDYIPANTGVLLYAANPLADLKVKALTEKPAEASEYYSMFFGYDEDTTPEETDGLYYKLQYSPSDDKVGFYFGAPDGAPFLCKANRAYLKLSNEISAPKFFALPVDDATAIKNANATANSNARYSINGQKVNANYRGIVIENGKKMLVK